MIPEECAYDNSVTVTGLPSYATHDAANRQFEIDSDTALSESFDVKVTSTVEFFKDFTLTEKETVSQSFDMVIKVKNPC